MTHGIFTLSNVTHGIFTSRFVTKGIFIEVLVLLQTEFLMSSLRQDSGVSTSNNSGRDEDFK